MFNFLASQHRQLPESRPCDEDEDDVKLKCSRSVFFSAAYLNTCISLYLFVLMEYGSDGCKDDTFFHVFSKHFRRATSTELPMAMRFRHLEKTSKEAVGVYR